MIVPACGGSRRVRAGWRPARFHGLNPGDELVLTVRSPWNEAMTRVTRDAHCETKGELGHGPTRRRCLRVAAQAHTSA